MFPQQPMRNIAQQGRQMMNPRMMGRGASMAARQFFPQQQITGAGVTNGGAGGGLKGMLSKFLPGSGGGAASAPAAASGGASAGLQGIQNLASPASLSSMLGNVQKVLGMAQQVTPMIQQYGPLVRNLPAMMKLYSQLSSNDDETAEKKENETAETKEEAEKDEKDETEKTSETDDDAKSSTSSKTTKQTSKKTSAQASASKKKEAAAADSADPPKPKRTSGRSKPKLYI
ncbi:hypothetical protein J7E26_10595 [Bacillus sp. ISL-51]|uniref:VrrA/YqfQ family protein n=1 Tax=unclassified Bacillus (in: firmicutes) TaxID=185979 RepID=UPI001BEBEAD1|nr:MULTISPECIES: VrrA/YqfQ family protein [unclassified Bacillus (in: firmicutes)]MBT2574398.1 hypothetical protein [Bacillus sp. ISL-51]MBT2633215.1 hypothetical protein [Bacillus sp. ISL-26]